MSTTTAIEWVVDAFLAYLALMYSAYLALAALGAVENAVRRRETHAEDYATLANSRFTIPVSVLPAAYKEAAGVNATVRSLLALEYPEFEVIVVNDGSTDSTLDVLGAEFALEQCELFPRQIVETEPVRSYFRSATHPRLIVVDKDRKSVV